MIQEEKDLLLKVLCAMLPYGVIVYHPDYDEPETLDTIFTPGAWNEGGIRCTIDDNWDSPHEIKYCKPYLRPMLSMTEEEHVKLKAAYDNGSNGLFDEYSHIDWLNANHFDYRGLIERGLALEAPEGMYNIKEHNKI